MAYTLFEGIAGVRGEPGRDRNLLADRENPSVNPPTGEVSSLFPSDTRGDGSCGALSTLRSDGDFFVGGDVDEFGFPPRRKRHQNRRGAKTKSMLVPTTKYFLSKY